MDERIDQLRQALREDPSSREFFRLGEALRRAGELDEAAEVLGRGLAHHPRYVAAWVALGRVELERGRFAEAEAACARALDVDPENAVAARLIGEAASRRGDWRRALAAWRLALALTPGDSELEGKLAQAENALEGESLAHAGSGMPAEAGETAEAGEPSGSGGAAPSDEPAVLPRTVVSLEDEEPFAVHVRGDTGVWATGEDVFLTGSEEELEAASTEGEEAVFGDVPVTSCPEPHEGEAAARGAGVSGPAPEMPAGSPGEGRVEEPAQEEMGPETAAATAETPASGVPLPTVTLARLALQQGDHQLARHTLDQVIALRGESDETRELLAELEAAEAAGNALALGRRKIERLQGWVQAVRLAAESQGHGV